MATASSDSSSEMAILRRVVGSEVPYLSREAAREILRLEFNKHDQRRMNQLAAKNRRGELTVKEDNELANFIRVGQTIGILKSKARLTLRRKSTSNGKK